MPVFLFSFLSMLYVHLRGNSIVTTKEIKENVFKRKYHLRAKNGSIRTVVFRCKQYRHTVKYRNWFVPNKVVYTYTVEMVNLDDDLINDYHVAHYPHLCSRWLHGTDYPHMCAVNAHIDQIAKYNE